MVPYHGITLQTSGCCNLSELIKGHNFTQMIAIKRPALLDVACSIGCCALPKPALCSLLKRYILETARATYKRHDTITKHLLPCRVPPPECGTSFSCLTRQPWCESCTTCSELQLVARSLAKVLLSSGMCFTRKDRLARNQGCSCTRTKDSCSKVTYDELVMSSICCMSCIQ